MKSLYQYLTESTFGPSDWIKHTYALDVIDNLLDGKSVLIGPHGEGGSISKDDFDVDVLQDLQQKLMSGKVNRNDVEDFNNAYHGKVKDGRKIWSNIYKSVYSGKAFKVSTKDQESITCIVFNNIVREMANDPNFEPDDEWMNDKYLGVNIDKSWSKSIKAVCMIIINHMKQLGADVGNFRMERLNGHQKGQEVAIAMGKFIAKYCKHIGMKKDAIDPSDVFIYDVNSKNEVLGIIDECTEKIDNDFRSIRQYIIDKFYTSKIPIFGGISLKKISSNPHLELCNVNNDADNIKVTEIGEPVISSKTKNGTTGQTCTVRLKGQFGGHCTRARLEFRTQGSATLRASVTPEDENGRRYPAQWGDCPINKFDEIVGLKDHKASNIDANFAQFQDFIATNPLKDMTKIVRMAMKNYDYNLPYIIIH